MIPKMTTNRFQSQFQSLLIKSVLQILHYVGTRVLRGKIRRCIRLHVLRLQGCAGVAFVVRQCTFRLGKAADTAI